MATATKQQPQNPQQKKKKTSSSSLSFSPLSIFALLGLVRISLQFYKGGIGGVVGITNYDGISRSTSSIRRQTATEDDTLSSSSRPAASSSSSSSLKIAIYMTTHRSLQHLEFLERCWKAAVARFPLLQQADLIVYDTSPTQSQQHTTAGASAPNPQEDDDILYQLGFANTKIYYGRDYDSLYNTSLVVGSEPRKQHGAITAMLAPFAAALQHNNINKTVTSSWFDGYDWIIRLNPDVLLRRVDDWLLPTMLNNSIDAILIHYFKTSLHTDFFAFRPHAINPDRMNYKFQKQTRRGNGAWHAETHLYSGFRDLIEDTTSAGARVAWLPNVTRMDSSARVGGPNCPVVHDHSILQHCPNYFLKS